MYYANISDAKASLSRLIEMVTHGEDVVIGKAGKPLARIIQYRQDLRPRQGGQWKGKVCLSPDFDELPSDIMQGFTGHTS